MKIEKWTLGLAAAGLVTLSPTLVAQTTNEAPPAPPAPIIPIQTALSATTISGFVDTSAVWNPGTGNANPAPYAFNAGRQDGFNVDDIDIKISKPFDAGKWSAGYVAELNYGPESFGIDGGAAPLRQAYVDLEVPVGNGLELQLGRWNNVIGYEATDSDLNPNWTHSYAWSFEPTEHTGLLGLYTFASWINVQAGVADTLTTVGLNARAASGGGAGGPVVESKKTIVSLLTLTAPDNWGFLKGSAFYVGFDRGQGVYGHDQSDFYLGATLNTPVKGLTFGGSYDSIDHNDIAGLDGGYFTSVVGYGIYQITDKARISGRAEYARGTALSSAEVAANSTFVNVIPIGTLDKVVDFTGTFEYDLWANVMSRIEVRWDHNAGGGGPAFGGTIPGIPTKNNELMVAANVIYKF
jgi:hypothetical protein